MLCAHGYSRTSTDGVIAPPRLARLERRGGAANDQPAEAGVTLGPDARGKSFALFASTPLAHDNSRPLAEGELVVVRNDARLAAGR
ncbi:MAG: hypothetical protein ACLPN5_04205 [Roseiarcus sp.]